MTSASHVEQRDVLIIGGGPQGLWVLDRLRGKGYSCLLMEQTAAGAGQSAHAEWYIHHGCVFKGNPPFFSKLRPSAQQWTNRLNGSVTLARSPARSYIAFADAPPDLLFQQRWKQLTALSPPFAPPFNSILKGTLFETSEFSITPAPVLKSLVEDNRGFAIKTTGPLNVQFSADARCVEQVDATCANTRTTLSVRPCAVVVTAGASNQDLLAPTCFGADPISFPCQRSRHSLMLVIRDSDNQLPDVNVFFWEDDGLMVVSRHDDGVRYWLVTVDQGWRQPDQPPFDEASAPACVKILWKNLTRRFPFVASIQNKLSYTISLAALVEPNFKANPPMPHVCTFNRPANLLSVYPQRLTLAPHWADEVTAELGKMNCRPSGDRPAPFGWPLANQEPSQPVWHSEPFLDWSTFDGRYLT